METAVLNSLRIRLRDELYSHSCGVNAIAADCISLQEAMEMMPGDTMVHISLRGHTISLSRSYIELQQWVLASIVSSDMAVDRDSYGRWKIDVDPDSFRLLLSLFDYPAYIETVFPKISTVDSILLRILAESLSCSDIVAKMDRYELECKIKSEKALLDKFSVLPIRVLTCMKGQKNSRCNAVSLLIGNAHFSENKTFHCKACTKSESELILSQRPIQSIKEFSKILEQIRGPEPKIE